MGGLVSRRKRSKVRSVSTQATECIPGRVLHEVTDPHDAHKLRAGVTQVTIGDGLQTSPVTRKSDGFTITRRDSLVENKKRRGLSKVLKARPKVGKKQQTPDGVHRVDFSTQYDFLALPGQVSPSYRRHSIDGSSTEKRQGPRIIRPSRPQTSTSADLARASKTKEAAVESGDPQKAHVLPTEGGPQARIGIRSTSSTNPFEQAGNTTGTRYPTHDDGEEQADENCNILKEGTLLAEILNTEVFGACNENEIPALLAKTNVSSPLCSTRNHDKRSPQQAVDVGRGKTLENVQSPGVEEQKQFSEVAPELKLSLEEILQNNIPLHMEVRETAAVTAVQPPDDTAEGYQSERGTRIESVVTTKDNEFDEGAGTSSSYFGEGSSGQGCSGAVSKLRPTPQKQADEEAQSCAEDQEAVAAQDEEMAEDTLDWNADDRTRSPSDSRPNSIGSSYEEDEDCTIDPMETAVNDTSLTTLKDGDSAGGSLDLHGHCPAPHPVGSSTSKSPQPLCPSEEVGTNLDVSADTCVNMHVSPQAGDSKPTSPLAKTLDEPKLSIPPESETVAAVTAPLVIPEETESLSAFITESQTSPGRAQQLRDVCIQKSCEEDEASFSSTCAGPAYYPEDRSSITSEQSKDTGESQSLQDLSPKVVMTVDTWQQTSPAPPDPEESGTADKTAAPPEQVDEVPVDGTASRQPGESTEKIFLKMDSPQKSPLCKQETPAMTLLILSGALPSEADSEGAIMGAGDAQNWEAAAAGVDESQEANEREGIASMLRTQSKSSCQLEQLQATDHFESLSRLADPKQTPPARQVASDDSSVGRSPPLSCVLEDVAPDGDRPCNNSVDAAVRETTADNAAVADISDSSGPQEKQCAQVKSTLSPPSLAQLVQQKDTPNHTESPKPEACSQVREVQTDNACPPSQPAVPSEAENQQSPSTPGQESTAVCEEERGTASSHHPLLAVIEEEVRAESIPSSTECTISSSDLAAASLEEIPDGSESSPKLEENDGAGASASEEDWEVIPLRRVPAHTDLGCLASGASSAPQHLELLQYLFPGTETETLHRHHGFAEEAAAAFSTSPGLPSTQSPLQQEDTAQAEVPSQVPNAPAAPPVAILTVEDPEPHEVGDHHSSENPPAEASTVLEEKKNVEVEIPAERRNKGTGDLPSTKAAAAVSEVVTKNRSEYLTNEKSQEAPQDNINNSQSQGACNASGSGSTTSATGKRKKKKRGGGKGKQKK